MLRIALVSKYKEKREQWSNEIKTKIYHGRHIFPDCINPQHNTHCTQERSVWHVTFSRPKRLQIGPANTPEEKLRKWLL